MPISKERSDQLKEWFVNYVQTFENNEPEIQQNIDLKEVHSIRVSKEIINIGKQLGLTEEDLRLAEIIALLHDIGRFEQYTRYKTFADRNSEDHAELGVKILEKSGLLESFDRLRKDIIVRAIRYHNRASLPIEETDPFLFYAKLIRDADKVDIWKVVTDYYYRKKSKENGAIGLDLPDTPGFSECVLQNLRDKKIVDMKYVKNLNDFKLLQVGWVFDINFEPTFKCIKERRYLELLRRVLPESKEIDEIFDIVYTSCG